MRRRSGTSAEGGRGASSSGISGRPALPWPSESVTVHSRRDSEPEGSRGVRSGVCRRGPRPCFPGRPRARQRRPRAVCAKAFKFRAPKTGRGTSQYLLPVRGSVCDTLGDHDGAGQLSESTGGVGGGVGQRTGAKPAPAGRRCTRWRRVPAVSRRDTESESGPWPPSRRVGRGARRCPSPQGSESTARCHGGLGATEPRGRRRTALVAPVKRNPRALSVSAL